MRPISPVRRAATSTSLLFVLSLSACNAYLPAEASPIPERRASNAPVTDAGCVLGPGDPAVAVEPLRAPDGSCVGASSLVVFRCDPAVDPAAVLDAGDDDATFLGGAYAVPVETVPRDAIEVGVGPSGRFRLLPGDPAALYLESGGRRERWLPLPDPSGLDQPPTIHLIGDSILDGATAALEPALATWSATVDASVGRSSSAGGSLVEALPAAPDVLVVELGTNDESVEAFAANAARILAAPAASGADLIVWITVRRPSTLTDAINREVERAAASQPRVTLIDWDALAPPEALNGDGVHLQPGQEGVFADVVARPIDRWRAAVRGRGPTACREVVLAEASLG